MDKKLLKEEITKYARFEVDKITAITGYDNFEELFKFIGDNSNIDKDNYETRAYLEIRRETDKILKVSSSNDRKLKTSKYEIKTIRKCFRNIKNKNYTMKIPYKIGFIFAAIVNIVERIKKEGKPLPDNLNNIVGMCYGIAFYNKYIQTYMRHFNEIHDDYMKSGYGRCRYELVDCFTSPSSPFSVIFD